MIRDAWWTATPTPPSARAVPLAATPDLWDEIVGIPLDTWMTAATSDDVADLIQRREAGDFLPKPPPTYEDCPRRLEVHAFDIPDPVRYLCDCGRCA